MGVASVLRWGGQAQVRKIGSVRVVATSVVDVSALVAAAGITEETGDVIIGVSTARFQRPISMCAKGYDQWYLGSAGAYANTDFPAVQGYHPALDEPFNVYYIKTLL